MAGFVRRLSVVIVFLIAFALAQTVRASSPEAYHTGDEKRGFLVSQQVGLGILLIGIATVALGTNWYVGGINDQEEAQDLSYSFKKAEELYAEGRLKRNRGGPIAVTGGVIALSGLGMMLWEPVFGPVSSVKNVPAVVPVEGGAAVYGQWTF